MTGRAEPCRLSVVVACVEAVHTLPDCLAALRAACEGIDAEILLVHGPEHPLPAGGAAADPRVRAVSFPEPGLVPHLWAEGFRASRGAVVAFSTAHCIVGPEWARSLLDALDGGATGAGGALRLAAGAGPPDWAVYFLRYSAFMPPAPRGPVAEIPGDNAAYLRSALERYDASMADGFWEVEFHRHVRATGGVLVSVPEATVGFGTSFSFRTIFRQRFQHGWRCGADRVRAGGTTRLRGVAAVPLVPLLLSARILRRTTGWTDRMRALVALPWILTLAMAWAAGEGRGAWSERRDQPLLT